MKVLRIIIAALFILILTKPAYAQSTPYSLIYSTYLGGIDFEHARDIDTDVAGNTYIVGGTKSADFPFTDPNTYYNSTGTCSPAPTQGNMNVFIVKLDPNGTMLWSKQLGGPCYDRAYAVEVGSDGNIYLGGRAGGSFYTTPGVIQPNAQFTSVNGDTSYNLAYGYQNAFIAKFDPNGTLVWSTLFGNDRYGFFRDIDVDSSGSVYAAMTSIADQIPEIDTAPAGFDRIFDVSSTTAQGGAIVKFTPDASALAWATYLNGSNGQFDFNTPSVRVDDANGVVYGAGAAQSTNMPVNNGADQIMDGASDMYIVKLGNATGNLIWGTYLGGGSAAQPNAHYTGAEYGDTHNLTIDSSGNPVISAVTRSIDFPTTAGVIQPSTPVGTTTGNFFNQNGDGFITKLNANTSQIIASTYLSSIYGEGIEGVGVDQNDNIYVSVSTYWDIYPVTSDNYQNSGTTIGGLDINDVDCYITILSPDLNQRLFATYFSGSAIDRCLSTPANTNGTFYVVGETESTDFPVLNSSILNGTLGANDAFVFKFAQAAGSTPTVTTTPVPPTPTPTSGAGSITVNIFSAAGDGRADFFGGAGTLCGLTQWNTARSSLTGGVDYTNALRSNLASSGCQGNNAISLTRGFLPFDTSSLPDNAIITGAKLYLYVTGKTNAVNDGNDYIAVVQSTQASPLTLVDTDYSKVGNVVGSDTLDITSMPTSVYNTWTLNPTGLSWISTTGPTLLAIREGHDILDIWGGFTTGQGDGINVAMSEQTGTNQDPYLEITYTLPSASATPAPVAGDSDGDGNVTITDFIIWKDDFTNSTSLSSDFDGDGNVTILDFIVWKNAFTAG